MQDQYMTVREARVYLGISGHKIAQLIRDGILKWEADPLDKRHRLLLRAEVEALVKRLPAAA